MRIVSYYSRAVSDLSGATAALWAWAGALSAAGADVIVAHAGGPRRSPDPTWGVRDVSDTVVRHAGRSRSTYVPVGLRRVLKNCDVLVLHEGWVVSNLVAAALATTVGVPYVVVPHGVYEPGIRASLKRPRLIRNALERLMLERALAVHVFWDSEQPLVNAVAPRARTLVVPTGFTPGAGRWQGGGGYIAWLGRFDPVHKGLDQLLEGLARVDPVRRPKLRLHGPDYNGGLDATRDHVRRLGLGRWVAIGPPIYGAEKDSFLSHAEAYVHPSRWESHSIALLENLALGVPSIVSDAIHIAPALRVAGAAILVPPTPEGLASGFNELANAAPTLSDRARAFVRTELAWPTVTDRFLGALSNHLADWRPGTRDYVP
jgi:glycosyltransferase involved in cell wall biosynthesis